MQHRNSRYLFDCLFSRKTNYVPALSGYELGRTPIPIRETFEVGSVDRFGRFATLASAHDCFKGCLQKKG